MIELGERRDNNGTGSKGVNGQPLAVISNVAEPIRPWLIQSGVEMIGRSEERREGGIGAFM